MCFEWNVIIIIALHMYVIILAWDLFRAFSFNIYNMCLKRNKDLFERVTILKCSTMLCGLCTYEKWFIIWLFLYWKTLNILRCENKLSHFFMYLFLLINEHLLCESCIRFDGSRCQKCVVNRFISWVRIMWNFWENY